MAGTALRLLLLYDCVFPESVGGVEHRNWELARTLAARGHRVTLAGWTGRAESGVPGIELLPLPYGTALYGASGRRRAAAALNLARAALGVRASGYDVVETANIPYAHVLPLALRCRAAGVPLVVSWYEHWGSYWREYVGWKWPAHAVMELLTAQLGWRATAISELTAGRLRRARRRRDEVEVIPSGIPYARLREVAGSAPPRPAPLVYAGRLQREKRIDLLLEAVARLPSGGSSPLLELVGDGPDRRRLEALAAGPHLSSRVVFAGRLETAAAVWRRVAGARVAVQPSAREGFGMFPLEAMALGLPVVHCQSPESAVPELVRHEREGLAAAATPTALAAALERLLADDELRRRLARAAVERASGYDWSRVGDRMESLFHRAAESRPRQRG